MNILQKLLNPSSEKLVTLTLSRGCFINGSHHAAGETLQVSSRIAGELVAADNAVRRDLDQAAEAERQRLTNLIPGPVEPRPMPPDWQELPPAFHQLWAMEEQANCLVERRSRIWEKLMQVMGRHRPLGDGLGNWKATFDRANFGLQQKLQKAVADLHVGQLPEDHLKDVRCLKDAYERSEQAVRDWNTANADKWQVSRFHASQHLLKTHGQLCRGIRQLHALGREIFSERISALGLAETKVSDLFHGSADCIRFASIEPPTIGDIRLAYSDGESDPAYYVEKTPEVMVHLLRKWEGIEAEVSALTKQARGELTKIRKVQAAA